MRWDDRPRWPTVARDSEFNQALAAFDDESGFRGVVLVGQNGVGKSTLARALAEAAESRGCTVRFALGSLTGRDIPLGAFSRALTVETAGEPAVMLAAAHGTLERQRDLVVVVDDAQLLDPLSATLLHQLAADSTARLIVTVGSGENLPDPVRTLMQERWLLHLRIEPFTREQTAQLARAVLDGAVGERLTDDLYRRTAGNVLLLRGLLSPGRENGALVYADDGWQLRGPLRPDDELHDLLAFRLQSLDPEERWVIEILAVAEVLDWQVLRELCDTEAAARMERLGMIQLLADGSDTVAQLNHPVIGEIALQLAGVVRTRTLNGLLARAFTEQLAAGGRRLRLPDVRGRIRLAQFMMGSDLAVDLDVIIGAAESAITLAHFEAAHDLARFALDHGGGLPAAIPLAEALRWQGRSAEAETVLAALEPDRDDPLLTARWGCLRAINLFDGCGRLDEARTVLTGLRDILDCRSATSLVDATEVSFDFFAGNLAAAITNGMALCCPDSYPMAAVTAAMPTSWALALSGRLTDTRAVTRAGLRAADHCASGVQRLAIGLAEAVALTATGDLAAAESVAQHYVTLSAGTAEAHAMVNAVLAYVQLAGGKLAAAAAALRQSVEELAGGFQPAGLILAAAWWAQAESALGNADAAAAALRYADDAYGPQVAVFLPEVELGRSWMYATAGQTTLAQEHALRAAQLARDIGLHFVELRALNTAIRFGERSRIARLAELSRILPAGLPAVMTAQARAVADQNGAALDRCADRFIEIGALALAADAAALAARAHARAGNRTDELAASSRALQLADETGLRSPATLAAAQPLPITGREREIAVMVAAGLTNREIAGRLRVSVRTVDGHLYRMFGKLGIQTREQLTHLVSGGDPGEGGLSKLG